MALGCGPKIAKFILFVFNIVFWLSGLLLIIVGAVTMANGTLKYIDDVVNVSTNRNILIGLVVIGSIIFVIGFCGCCGAIKESRMLLAIYIVLVLLIIVAEVAIGIFAIVKRQTFESSIKKEFDDTFMKRYTNDTTITKTVDAIQKDLKCCGVNKSDDWRNSEWYLNYKKLNETLPRSCCIDDTRSCSASYNNFVEGCMSRIEDSIKKCFPIIIGVVLGIAFFEIFVVICAFCLCRNTDPHSQSV